MVIGKKIPAVGFVDRESKCVTKFYHAVCNSKLKEIVLGLPAAGEAALTFPVSRVAAALAYERLLLNLFRIS